MIRLLCVVLLTFIALIGLSLRVSREAGELSEPVRRAVAQVTTLDLGSALPALAVDSLVAVLGEGESSPEAPPADAALADARPIAQDIAETRYEPFVEALPCDAELESETQQVDDDAVSSGPVAEIDQQAWADLIRRMLAVYPRSGSNR